MLNLIKELLFIIIGAYVISQIILPCFFSDLDFFNLHKKQKVKTKQSSESKEYFDDLEKKAIIASQKINEVKTEIKDTEIKINNVKKKIEN